MNNNKKLFSIVTRQRVHPHPASRSSTRRLLSTNHSQIKESLCAWFSVEILLVTLVGGSHMNRKIKRAYYSLIFETKPLWKRNTRTQITCRNFVRILACLIVTTFTLNGIPRVVNQEAFILIEYVVKSCKTPIHPNGAAFWHRKFYGVSRELLEKHLPQEGTSLDIWFRSFIRRTAKQHHNFIWHLRSVCTGVGEMGAEWCELPSYERWKHLRLCVL